MKIRFLQCFVLFLLCSEIAVGQLFLQLEKVESTKRKRYFVGDNLGFKLISSGEWVFGEIDQLILDSNIVILDGRIIRLEDIVIMRTTENRKWSKLLAGNLYVFGIGWSGFAFGSSLVKVQPGEISDPYTWGDALVSLTSVGLGVGIQMIFRNRDYKVKRNRRLRLVDLRIGK